MTITATNRKATIGWAPGAPGSIGFDGDVGGAAVSVGYSFDGGTTYTPFELGDGITALAGFKFDCPGNTIVVEAVGGTPDFTAFARMRPHYI